MNQSLNKQLRVMAEMQAFRKVVEYVWDGNQEAFQILLYLRRTYVKSNEMIIWLKNNKICGKNLVDFFKNESDASGGGYMLGCAKILSAMEGKKYTERSVKVTDLL